MNIGDSSDGVFIISDTFRLKGVPSRNTRTSLREGRGINGKSKFHRKPSLNDGDLVGGIEQGISDGINKAHMVVHNNLPLRTIPF